MGVGDYYASSYSSTSNSYHYRLTDSGSFTRVTSSLWYPVQYGSLVYTESSGTLCIGGYDGNEFYYTQIVTANSGWSVQPTSSNHYLAQYSSSYGYYKYLGVTV